jgi:hypothetical protein
MPDIVNSGSITLADGTSGVNPPAGSYLDIGVEDHPAVSLDLEGAFTATLVIEAISEAGPTGADWFTPVVLNAAGVASSATLTAAGRRFISAAGLARVRLRCTAFTNGPITATWRAGQGFVSAGGGGGGGGGAVTVADGANTALGTTTDAGIITNIAGTAIGFLRGQIIQWAAFLARLPAALVGGRLDVNIGASAVTQPVSGTVTANAGTGTLAVSAAALPLPAGASTETTLAAASAKLPAALVGARLDVNLGAAPATLTANATLQAGTATAGNIGGLTKTVTATLTRPANTTTYTAGDEMVDTGGAIRTISSIAAGTGKSGIITHCLLSCSSNGVTKPTFIVYVYDTTSTPQTDNAAFTPADGEQDTCIGSFPLSAANAGDATASTGNFTMDSGQIHLPFTTVGAADLYFRVQVTNGYTPGTNSDTYRFRFTAQQDA